MNSKCKLCNEAFETSVEDLKFLEKVAPICEGKRWDIPAPTLCPQCRQKRRFAYRNERSLYHRKCDKCGVSMISMIHPSADNKVYCEKCWWGADFDPRNYGQEYDFKKPFFEQFKKLMNNTPLPNLVIGDSENSDYTNYCWSNKDCYLISASDYNQDCYYSTYLFRSRDCFDCLFVNDSELCYECVDAKKCYACAYLQNCQDLRDSYFCFDCRGCENCLGCVGLRRKKYYIFNKEYSKAEYEKKKAEFFSKNKNMNELRKSFVEFRLKFPHKFAEIENCENSTGDHLMASKKCESCFDMVEAQDCKYSALGIKAKDCLDCTGTPKGELYYEVVASPEDYNMAFSSVIWPKSTYLFYCLLSRSSNYCFGGVSLLKNEYCILNKQYTKEEYEKLLPKVIEHMRETKEWGEFFPMEIAPFSYNETLAQDYYPMSENEIREKGLNFYEDHSEKLYKGPEYKIPENTEDVDEEICKKILICESTDKPYKIIPQEFDFYRKMKLPIPRMSPDARHTERMKLRNPRRLWERDCVKCGKKIFSSYDPERPEIVYCEECYLKQIG